MEFAELLVQDPPVEGRVKSVQTLENHGILTLIQQRIRLRKQQFVFFVDMIPQGGTKTACARRKLGQLSQPNVLFKIIDEPPFLVVFEYHVSHRPVLGGSTIPDGREKNRFLFYLMMGIREPSQEIEDLIDVASVELGSGIHRRYQSIEHIQSPQDQLMFLDEKVS